MTHNTSDVATGATTALGVLFKFTAQAMPQDLTWVNDLGVLGCMGVAIFLLLKDRASLLKELKNTRETHEQEIKESRDKYEAKLQEIADKAEKRADYHSTQHIKDE